MGTTSGRSSWALARSLSEEVTIFLMVFIIIAISYAVEAGKVAGNASTELAPIAIWSVLSVLCWLRYSTAFLAAAVVGALGVIIVYSSDTSIQYDVIANFLVVPFGLRAFRELRAGPPAR